MSSAFEPCSLTAQSRNEPVGFIFGRGGDAVSGGCVWAASRAGGSGWAGCCS